MKIDREKMTDNKLTLADWYKYYEADVQFTTDDNTIQRGYVRAIQVHSDTELEIECFPISFYHKTVSDCKLILRDISQLTDDEKKYIAKNFLLVDWGVLEGRTNQITLIHIMSWCEFEKLKDLLDYFREIGIDIDGMFASGKAVKE